MAGVPWYKYTVRSYRRIIPQDCHGSLAYVQYIRVDGWGPISVNIGNIATFPLYTYMYKVSGYRRTIPGGLLGFPVVQRGVADWGPMYGYLGGVAGGYLVSGAIEGLYLEDC